MPLGGDVSGAPDGAGMRSKNDAEIASMAGSQDLDGFSVSEKGHYLRTGELQHRMGRLRGVGTREWEHPVSASLRARTPLWDNFFERLELATASEHGRELMKSYGVGTREWE